MYRLPKFFCPNLKTKLVRLGKSNDGGYCISKESLKETKILFSFGLAEDWSFEEDFKKETEAKIICFDASVNSQFWIKRFLKDLIYFNFKKDVLKQLKRFLTFFKYKKFFKQNDVYHIKKHLSSRDITLMHDTKKSFINFEKILNIYSNDCFFLKMDIEGNEYRILDDIVKNQKGMIGIAIEFHECDLMLNKIKDFIEKIDLDLVHIHVNNFCNIGKNYFPTVLELTFSDKKFNLKRNIDEFNFPNKEIDQPNNKEEEDKKISFF